MMTITIIMKKGREGITSRGRGRKECMVHNATAHHLLTDGQPVPKQQFTRPSQTPRYIFQAWCPMVWNTTLASLGQRTWLCPLPPFC